MTHSTPSPLTSRSLLLALAITFIWGVNFIVIKWSVKDASPLLVASLRFLVAAFPAVFFVPRPKVDTRILLGYGFACGVIQFGLLYLAIQLGMSAGMGSLIMQLQAFFTAILASRIFGESIKPWQALGMLIAFSGMGLIGFAGHDIPAFPLLLTLIAAMGWSCSNMLIRASGNANAFGIVIWSSLVPPIPLATMALLTRGQEHIQSILLHSDFKFWLAVAFMGLANTVLGFGVWARLIQKHGASRVAPLSLMVPVFGMFSSALVFHETFSAGKAFGALFVATGLLMHVFGGRFFKTSSNA